MLRHGQSTYTQKTEQNNTYQPRPPQGAHSDIARGLSLQPSIEIIETNAKNGVVPSNLNSF